MKRERSTLLQFRSKIYQDNKVLNVKPYFTFTNISGYVPTMLPIVQILFSTVLSFAWM